MHCCKCLPYAEPHLSICGQAGIGILKWNAGNNEATSLGLATDLSNYGSFQRGAVKEMMMFVARTVAKRMQSGQRHSVQRVRLHQTWLKRSPVCMTASCVPCLPYTAEC